MDKTLIKAVTKTKGEDTEDVYLNVLHKLYPSKQLFIPLLRTTEENAKSNVRHKGSC